MAVINSLERRLAKRISVQCSGGSFEYLCFWLKILLYRTQTALYSKKIVKAGGNFIRRSLFTSNAGEFSKTWMDCVTSAA